MAVPNFSPSQGPGSTFTDKSSGVTYQFTGSNWIPISTGAKQTQSEETKPIPKKKDSIGIGQINKPNKVFEQFMAETGRQGLLNRMKGEGQFDKFKSAYERGALQFNDGGPQPGQQDKKGSSPEESVLSEFDRTEKLIKEQFDFVKGFLKDNPFAFDEAQAKSLSQSKFRPFFEEQLKDFIEPIQDKISRSSEDRDKIVNELVRRRELGETDRLEEIGSRLDQIRGGAATRGLLGAGQQTRVEARDEIQGKRGLDDFLAKSRLEQGSIETGVEREKSDLERSISNKERDIFGKGRGFETAVLSDVQKRRQTGLGQTATQAEFAFSERFGSDLLGSGQKASSLAKQFLQ